METLPIKRIKYVDSALSESQQESILKPLHIEAVGFVINETEDSITICRELIGNGEYRGMLAIPKEAIKWSK